MHKCGQKRSERPSPKPHWIEAMRLLNKVDRNRKQRDQACGVVNREIIHTDQDLNGENTPDEFPITLEIQTSTERELNYGDPIELKLHLDTKRHEKRVTPNALERLKERVERALSDPVYLHLATSTWQLSEPLADNLATWSHLTNYEPPPGGLSHLATVRTFSDTDPPQAPMPKHRTTNLDLAWVGYGQAKRALVTLCT